MDPILVGGRWVTADRAKIVRAPHSWEPLAELALASAAQVEQAIDVPFRACPVAAALPSWRRAEILLRIAEALRADAEPMARTICQEAAKPIDLARGEVARAAETFTFAAHELQARRGESIPLDASPGGIGKFAMTHLAPIGLTAAITPFNFPLNLVAHKLAPAIAAGCPIVHKPASSTPLTALRLAHVILEAGWPPEALSVIYAAGAEAQPLATDERIALLSFTGSDEVGWRLKAISGRKHICLELGGDAALIVEPDLADWDRAVRRTAAGAFAYAGQVCISVQRVLVHRSIHDRFLADLVDATRNTVRVGPPEEPGVLSSSLIDDGAADRVADWVAQAQATGATLHCGGRRGEGRLFDPMVLTEVSRMTPLGCQEAFGPIVTVSPYDDLDEAFATVNASRYGLQAGIFTSDLRKAHRALTTIEAGAVVVGDVPTFRVDHMPYGGVKNSGFGREGLRYALREYTTERLLVADVT